MKAYIKSDLSEDPEVLDDLFQRLKSQGITPALTDRSFKEIHESGPFLFFRNAYIRFDHEGEVAKFHHESFETPTILAVDNEVISYNPLAKGGHDFVLNLTSYAYTPKISPLPILLGTHKRPLYYQLTLNSLIHTCKDSRQKIYIVVSQPDAQTLKTTQDYLERYSQLEAVLVQDNLRYAFANFGSKFFKLKKFIHHEDDGIIPENVEYYLPYWANQLNHRSSTADLVTFRIFEGNWTPGFLKSSFLLKSQRLIIPSEVLWYYAKPAPNMVTPIGGMGMVIDSPKMYKDFKPPNYSASDHGVYHSAKVICLANVPIYHIGANYLMDYPEYALKKQNTQVDRVFTGVDMRTQESRTIDLGVDWEEHA